MFNTQECIFLCYDYSYICYFLFIITDNNFYLTPRLGRSIVTIYISLLRVCPVHILYNI